MSDQLPGAKPVASPDPPASAPVLSPNSPGGPLTDLSLTEAEVDSRQAIDRIRAVEVRLNELILGQEPLIRAFLTGLLARGHILLEGLPGLGKTRLARALSGLCDLETRRIQFTPDLMPLDITGSYILNDLRGGGRQLEFHPGPLFGNLILADEINRASPKTQSALLEAMQEQQVTVLGHTHVLPDPFLVIATQNPIEQEGTYPLPEAQLDRFLFKLHVEDVPVRVLEAILMDLGRGELPVLKPLVSRAELRAAMAVGATVTLSRPVAAYIARLVKATHPEGSSSPGPGSKEVASSISAARHIKHGASPRAALAMAMASRARALLEGRQTVGFEDVKAVALPSLRHRIILDYRARLDGVTSDDVVAQLLESVPELERSAPASVIARLG